MRPKTSIILFLSYFLIINTQYYWEQNIGFIVIIFITINFILFISLLILVVVHLINLSKKEDRLWRIASVVIGIFVLLTTYIKPYGIINFEKFESKPILRASSTGGGNCNTQFKLYANNTFVEKQRCFSISTTKGNWKLLNDTIYFSNVRIGVGIDEFYEFALIKKSISSESLVRFKDNFDSIGNKLWIHENELNEK